MPTAGRSRQKMSGHERRAAIAAARRRSRRNQRLLVGGTCIVALAGIVAFVWRPWSDDAKTVETTRDKTTASTTPTTPANGSAAGRACVAAEAPPPGAPAVPVNVGPPPASMVSQDLRVGDGAVVGPNDSVTVNYIGVSCSTGKTFDSSYSRGQPANFPLNQVIDGWKTGIPGMKVGGQRLLGIPPGMAYGTQGRPGIAPDETLWFVVDVIDTKPS